MAIFLLLFDVRRSPIFHEAKGFKGPRISLPNVYLPHLRAIYFYLSGWRYRGRRLLAFHLSPGITSPYRIYGRTKVLKLQTGNTLNMFIFAPSKGIISDCLFTSVTWMEFDLFVARGPSYRCCFYTKTATINWATYSHVLFKILFEFCNSNFQFRFPWLVHQYKLCFWITAVIIR